MIIHTYEPNTSITSEVDGMGRWLSTLVESKEYIMRAVDT